MTKSLSPAHIVSDHAVLRYLERVLLITCHFGLGLTDGEALAVIAEIEGIDIELCRARIADNVRPAILAGARSVRIDGLKSHIACGRVKTTIRCDNRLPRKRLAPEHRGYIQESAS